MKPLFSSSILAIILLSSAFSNGGHAQAQANKTSLKATQVSASPSSTYASLHSPTLNSTTVGSPTVQQYEETFYDASQNPDYLSEQNLGLAQDASEDYFVADYDSYLAAKTIAQSTPEPRVDNNYDRYDSNYGYGSYYPSLFPTSSYRHGAGYPGSIFFSLGFGFNSFSPFSSFGYPGYGYNGYNGYNDFYYPNSYGSAFYGGYGNSYYYPSYLNSYNYVYCPPVSNYYSSSSGYNVYTGYYETGNSARQVVNTRSLNGSSVSYYANRSYDDIRRRDNYRAGATGTEGGRTVADDNGSRTRSNGTNSSTYVSRRTKRGGDEVVKRRRSVSQSSGTIQNNTNNRSRGGAVNRNTNVNRQKRSYVSRSSNGRSTNINRSTGRQSVNSTGSRQTRSGYSSHSPSKSYNRSSNKSSYRPTRSSAPSKSYAPRSNSGSRSRSYSAPSRSSSSRSVTRTSSSSGSRGSSSGRKQ
jgi:hypothetical protein